MTRFDPTDPRHKNVHPMFRGTLAAICPTRALPAPKPMFPNPYYKTNGNLRYEFVSRRVVITEED